MGLPAMLYTITVVYDHYMVECMNLSFDIDTERVTHVNVFDRKII